MDQDYNGTLGIFLRARRILCSDSRLSECPARVHKAGLSEKRVRSHQRLHSEILEFRNDHQEFLIGQLTIRWFFAGAQYKTIKPLEKGILRGYPLTPYVTMPCMKYFCEKKKRSRTGSITNRDAAINRFQRWMA